MATKRAKQAIRGNKTTYKSMYMYQEICSIVGHDRMDILDSESTHKSMNMQLKTGPKRGWDIQIAR